MTNDDIKFNRCKDCKFMTRGIYDIGTLYGQCDNGVLYEEYVRVYSDSQPIAISEKFGCVLFQPIILKGDS
jgi:hypothetical protein